MGKEQKENNLETRNDKLYEAAICFARMWGIHETLEPLPNLGFDRIRELVLGWAREYMEGGEEDMTGFFLKKQIQYRAQLGQEDVMGQED